MLLLLVVVTEKDTGKSLRQAQNKFEHRLGSSGISLTLGLRPTDSKSKILKFQKCRNYSQLIQIHFFN
jgi:hypothetical protein